MLTVWQDCLYQSDIARLYSPNTSKVIPYFAPGCFRQPIHTQCSSPFQTLLCSFGGLCLSISSHYVEEVQTLYTKKGLILKPCPALNWPITLPPEQPLRCARREAVARYVGNTRQQTKNSSFTLNMQLIPNQPLHCIIGRA